MTKQLYPHGGAPEKIWLIYPDDGGAPVLWTEPCPFPVDDGTVVEYHCSSLTNKLQKQVTDLRKRLVETDKSWLDTKWGI